MKALPSLLTVALLGTAPAAFAGNIAHCEVAVMQTVVDEDGGEVSFGSFRDAADFLKGVYDPETELDSTVDGHPIQGLICDRTDLMPDDDDYTILATGVPLVLTRDIDSPDAKTLTLFFADGAFQHRYAANVDIDEAFEETLLARLEDFSGRDHGLGVVAEAGDDAAEAEPVEPVEDISEPTADAEVVIAASSKSDLSDATSKSAPAEPVDFEADASADMMIDLETGELVPMRALQPEVEADEIMVAEDGE
ncbi:MAG: hypothetical protein WBF53_09750 [Litorimonas sp.]